MNTPNTTFDVYLGGSLPPATPDAAGLDGYLVDQWEQANNRNKGDRTFFWTATLEVPLGNNLPDLWSGSVSQTTVWVPDQTGDGYTVVFAERERSMRGSDFLRIYLVKGGTVAITIKEVDGTPNLTGVSTLLFDQADGFTVSQPAANQARIDLVLQMSIDVDASGIKLKNDSAAPGNSKYYGTDTGGTKGWYALPSAGMSNPMTTLGDIIYEDATPTPARLAGNTSATQKFLRQTGTGSASAAPSWEELTVANLPPGSGGSSSTPPAVPAWIKITKSHTDFQTAGTLKAIEIYSAPAGTVIHAVKLKHSTAFAGSGFFSYTISIETATEVFLAAFDVKQATGGLVYGLAYKGGTSTPAFDHSASTSITATARSSGANLDQSTAGSADFWLLVSKAT